MIQATVITGFEQLLAASAPIFEYMATAEAEIEAKAQQAPSEEIKAAIQDCFSLLMPSEYLRGYADWVYLAHCRELLDRAASGKRYDKKEMLAMTAAEWCCALESTSQKAPLIRDAFILYAKYFVVMIGFLDTKEAVFDGDGYADLVEAASQPFENQFVVSDILNSAGRYARKEQTFQNWRKP